MKRFFTSLKGLTLLAAALFAGSNADAQTTPVAMTPLNSQYYNADVILEGPIPTPATSYWYYASPRQLDTAFSKGTIASILSRYSLVSSNLYNTGLPVNGGPLTSVNTTFGNTPIYTLNPATSKNSMSLYGSISVDTLYFTDSTRIGDIFLLGAAGSESSSGIGSNGSATVTILFTDNTSQIVSGVSFPNYRDSSSSLPYAVTNIGRFNMNVNLTDGDNGLPRLFDIRVKLPFTNTTSPNVGQNNYTKRIRGIKVQKSGGDQISILGACIFDNPCLPTANVIPPAAPPTPPLTITSADTVKWNAVAGTAGYEYALVPYVTMPTPLPIVPPTGTVFSTTSDTFKTYPNGLSPDIPYVFFVRSKCSAGSPSTASVWNATSFRTPPCQTVSTAGMLTWATSTTQRIYFLWRKTNAPYAVVTPASNNNLGFEYIFDNTTTTTPTTNGTYVGPNDTIYNKGNLLTGTTYHLWVRNNCTGTSFSDWTHKTFPTQACPAAATTANITVLNNTPGTITLAYPGSTDSAVIGYQYALMPGSLTPGAADYAFTTDDTLTFNNLDPGQRYRFFVKCDCSNIQTLNPAISTVITNPFWDCDTSLNLSMNNLNMHGAELYWSSGSTNGTDPIQLYNISLTTTTNPANNYNPSLSVTLPNNAYFTTTTDTFFHPTNLAPNTSYCFFVRTQCDTVTWPPSTTIIYNRSAWKKICFTTPDTCVPPIIPTISNITTSSAHMEWNLYYGIDGYEYYIDQSPADPQSPPPAGSWPLITYNQVDPINLFSNTTYYFHLRTKCDATNYSPWTNTPFTTLPNCNTGTPSPALQTGSGIINPTATSAIFIWGAVPNATRYEVAVTTTATPPAVADDTITITTYNATGLTPNTDYYFHIKAKCSPNDSTTWASILFHTKPASSVSTLQSGVPILVYPNPVTEDLIIDIQDNPKGRIEVIDMTGKVLVSEDTKEQKTSINMKPFSKGVYMIKYFIDAQNVQIIRVQKI